MSISRFTPPRLRTLDEEGKRSATWLELFYDLAFVVAVAAVAERLLHIPGGIASYFGYFALLWWLWASHTFYADRYDTEDVVYRLLAGAQMVAVVIVASSFTGETTSTLAFAIGYAVARWVLILMYLRAYRHVRDTRPLVRGYLIGFGSAAVIWTISALVPEPERFVVWAVALTVDLATPWVMREEQARAPLDISHLPERFGLFTLLVLGESIAAVVGGLGHTGWTVEHVFAATLAIGVATGVWWMYFDTASGHVVRRSPKVRRTWRPTAWIYTHVLLGASLGALGVALELAILDTGHDGFGATDRWLLVGAAAFVLLSMGVIQLSSTVGEPSQRSRLIAINRLAGIPFLIVLGLLGSVAPAWTVIGLLGLCIAEIVADFAAFRATGDVGT